MTTSKFKGILRFLVINYILYVLITILTLLLPLVISFLAYLNHPTGTDDSFWVLPLVSLIPIVFIFRAIYFLFKNEFIKFVILIPMCNVMLFSFIILYNKNSILNDYHTLFVRIGVLK